MKPTGKSKHPLYKTWWCMVDRCTNENNPAYKHYGGRGIAVCKRWMLSLDSFVSDVGDRPADTTLDRINNDGSYCPENVRWSTKLMQSKNRRNRRSDRSEPKTVGAQVSADEHRMIVRKAKRAGIRKSTWIRGVILAALKAKGG